MRRLLAALYALPVLATVSASAVLTEPVVVGFCGLLACALTIVGTCALIGFVRSKRRPLWPIVVGVGVCFAILVSVMTTHWPLRIAYACSRPAIQRLASETLAGHSLIGPRRVGVICVEKAEVSRAGVVCLWTRVHPGGNMGFVRCNPGRVPFNLWSMIALDEQWQFIAED